jgi:hypothetical protein
MTSTEPTPETPKVTIEADASSAVQGLQAATASEPQAGMDWKSEAEKWKKLSQDTEKRGKSAIQAAEEYRVRAEQAEMARLRLDVALSKGIPREVVGALVGTTAEELSAHADALLAWHESATPATPPAPRPDPGQGPQPLSATSADDAEWEKFRAVLRPSNQ